MLATAPALASPGCGQAAPAEPPAVLDHAGRQREVIVAVSEGYDPAEARRLIVAFHGRTNDAARVRRYYGLEAVDDGRSIFVYPQATRQADGTFIWRQPEDVVFVEAIIDHIGALYCIDRDRVFVVGHSLGATFANTVACLRGDLVRGVGSVAGGISAQECRGEAAALLIHNPEDRLVPLEEGRRAVEVLSSGKARPGGGNWFRTCTQFGPPEGTNPVVLCLHDHTVTSSGRAYPHQWPPGAAKALLEFFDGLPEGALNPTPDTPPAACRGSAFRSP